MDDETLYQNSSAAAKVYIETLYAHLHAIDLSSQHGESRAHNLVKMIASIQRMQARLENTGDRLDLNNEDEYDTLRSRSRR